MTALQKLDARWQAGARICVGLDSRYEMLPPMFRVEGSGVYNGIRGFNHAIVRATKDTALAYKMNLAPYMRHGIEGIQALLDTFKFIHREAPDVLTILDSKPGDALADINADYAHFAFEQCHAGAMTAQVYAGGDAAEGFTRYADKLIFFLCKTSNEGSGDFQDLPLLPADPPTRSMPLYKYVARRISIFWNQGGNCGAVVGATYPEQMADVRSIIGDMPILAPGIGKQAGEFEKTIRAGVIPGLGRLIINESRSIIFAPYKNVGRDDYTSFAEAARQKLLDRTAEYNRILELEAA